MAKLIAPTAEWLSIGGENRLVFGDTKLVAIYNFLAQLAEEFNKLIAEDTDPETSPLSYVDHLIIKLKLCQPFFPSGTYLDVHVAPAHLTTFMTRMNAETRWRVANGQATPATSWLKKGGVLNLTDMRGLFPRFWSDNGNTDPDGWQRALGAYQDHALQQHQQDVSASLTGNGGFYNQKDRRAVEEAQYGNNPTVTWDVWSNGQAVGINVSVGNVKNANVAGETRPRNATVLRLMLA